MTNAELNIPSNFSNHVKTESLFNLGRGATYMTILILALLFLAAYKSYNNNQSFLTVLN
jgi:hypothetical protein